MYLGGVPRIIDGSAERHVHQAKDEYKKPAFWCGEQPLRSIKFPAHARVRDIKFAAQKLLVESEHRARGGWREAEGGDSTFADNKVRAKAAYAP